VKVVFVGLLEQMNGAESAGAREALDVRQNDADGNVSSAVRHSWRRDRRSGFHRSVVDRPLRHQPVIDNRTRRTILKTSRPVFCI